MLINVKHAVYKYIYEIEYVSSRSIDIKSSISTCISSCGDKSNSCSSFDKNRVIVVHIHMYTFYIHLFTITTVN